MSSCPRPSRAHSRGVRACAPGRVRTPLAASRPADPSGARGPDIGERLTTRPRPYPDAGPVRAQSLTPFPFVSFSRPVLLTTERRRPPSTSGAPFGAFLSAPALISPEQVGRMASSSSHSVSFNERRRNSSSADSLGTFQTIRFSASRGPCRGPRVRAPAPSTGVLRRLSRAVSCRENTTPGSAGTGEIVSDGSATHRHVVPHGDL